MIKATKLLPYNGIAKTGGSKSIGQRYIFLSSLVPCKLVMRPGTLCEDSMEMAFAARMGDWGSKFMYAYSIIDNRNGKPRARKSVHFEASATALRFWLARSLFVRHTLIYLSGELARRPLKPFLENLRQWGCDISVTKTKDYLYPYKLEITSSKNISNKVTVDADISSQFISGLMMAACLSKKDFSAEFKCAPVSYYYLELTRQVLASVNVPVELNERRFSIAGGSKICLPKTILIEPELAEGAFFLALGAFSENGVGITSKTPNRWQPDWEILHILQRMGAEVIEDGLTVKVKAGKLHGIVWDMEHFPDLVPLVAVLALFADGPTTLKGISRLIYKESDRIQGIINALKAIGAGFIYGRGCLKVFPLEKAPRKVILDTQNDHRLVIAFTLLKLHFRQVSLSEKKSVMKSSPFFFNHLRTLRRNKAEH